MSVEIRDCEEMITDIVLNIAVMSDDQTICDISSTNKVYNILCISEIFYKLKFIYDYGYEPKNITSWKKLYKSYGLYNLSHPDPVYIPNIKPKEIMYFSDNIFIKDINNKCVYLCQDNKRNIEICPDSKEKIKSKRVTDMYYGTYYNKINKKYKKITGSSVHLLMIDEHNNLYGMGSNMHGQMGDIRSNCKKPKLITDIKVKKITTSFTHTLMIDIDNNLWVLGNNTFGQLGTNEDTTDQLDNNSPILIPNIKAKKIYTSTANSYIIDLDNNIWSVGNNHYGLLGLGDNKDRSTFTMIPNIKAKKLKVSDTKVFIIDLEYNLYILGTIGSINIPKSLNYKAKHILFTSSGMLSIINIDDNIYDPFYKYIMRQGLNVVKSTSKDGSAICIGYYQ